MYKTKSHSRNYDIYGDLARVKEALAETAMDVGGKTSDMVSESLGRVKKRSSKFQTEMSDFLSDKLADKPFKTLALTLLSGMTIGFLMQRRSNGRYRRTK